MSARLLVAGVGNIFFGDDGFGCEVARALLSSPFDSDAVKVEDFGIAGLHLGYELINGYERAIIVDLAAGGGAPGTLYHIEPDLDAPGPPPDPHRMDLQNVFAFVRMLGAQPPAVEIVGCEPATMDEGIGLSPAVAAAVEPAAALVRELISRALSAPGPRAGATTWSEV